MNLLKMIFNGNDSANKMLDAGISGIDKLVFTQEEKAEHHAKLMDNWQQLQLKLAESGTGTAINRRVVAWAVVLSVLFNFQVAVVCGILGMTDEVATVIDIAKSFWVGEAFVAVIAFYFGAHAVKALVR